jgi:hypothetical protein
MFTMCEMYVRLTFQFPRLHFIQLVGEFNDVILHASQSQLSLKNGAQGSTHPLAGNPHCWISFASVARDCVTLNIHTTSIHMLNNG